jgi:hypothetical protein
MGLALVVVEEDARAAVHLADDHPLGAVDHEGTVRGHQRHVAHVDVLLLDVLDGLGAGILVHIEHDQPQGDLQRRGIGHVALLALLDVVFRMLELVADELQHGGLVEVLDREHRLEDPLNALAILRGSGVAALQEKVIRALLHLDEVWHLRDFADFAEELPNALPSGKDLAHVHPRSISACHAPQGGAAAWPVLRLRGIPSVMPAAPASSVPDP